MNERGLAAYVQTTLDKTHARQLEPFFQGTITAVDASLTTYATVVVQVRRTGEVDSDKHWHTCQVPNYTPQVGDVVDLSWRDDNVAHVAHPLAPVSQSATGPQLQQASLYGYGPSMTAGAPAVPRWLMQAGSNAGSTTGDGHFIIYLSPAFPGGVLTILCTPGDSASAFAQVQVSLASVTKSQFTVWCGTNGGTAIASGLVRVNWLVIGF